MNLLLDCGNTRLKWAISDPLSIGTGRHMVEKGVVDYESESLAVWANRLNSQGLKWLQYSSVISPEQEAQVLAALAPLGLKSSRFAVTAQAGKLHNLYATQETLGVDRWAAAIGAWGLVGQSCLVIGAGTATTVDLIESTAADTAVYRGGLILPGHGIMLRALESGTAGLRVPTGEVCEFPTNTSDALTSGGTYAIAGAVERMVQHVRQHCGAEPACYMTGGAGWKMAPSMSVQFELVDSLIFDGLLEIAKQRLARVGAPFSSLG